MKRITFMLIIFGLFLIAGCAGNKAATRTAIAPDIKQGQAISQTSSAKDNKQTIPDRNSSQTGQPDIIYTHSYSPGHSFRIHLPGTWERKYWVKESDNSVTFYFYKPNYLLSAPNSQQTVPQDEMLFAIEVYPKSDWDQEVQFSQSHGGLGNLSVIATHNNMVFVEAISLANNFVDPKLAKEYGQMAAATYDFDKTIEFVDGN